MPIYEFRCKKCGTIFEQLIFSSDGEEKPGCPSCSGNNTSRLMSAFSCGSSDKGSSTGLSSTCSSSSSGFS